MNAYIICDIFLIYLVYIATKEINSVTKRTKNKKNEKQKEQKTKRTKRKKINKKKEHVTNCRRGKFIQLSKHFFFKFFSRVIPDKDKSSVYPDKDKLLCIEFINSFGL